MISLSHVEQQLKKVGCNFRFWGRGEIRELANVLTSGETIAHCVNGRYEGGFAMLCVTDQRLLLVDHKPMFMAIEDIRFDMIAELDFSTQLLVASVKVITTSRTLSFSSWSQHHLREVLNYTQQRMLELRQQFATMSRQMQPMYIDDDPGTGLVLGNLALQTGGLQRPLVSPFNPYANRMPVLQRRRRYPRFY